MEIVRLQSRLKLMGDEVTTCHEKVQSLNATVQAQAEQINKIQRHAYHKQGEVELKEAELAVYYKHMVNLQERLVKTNEIVGSAQAQLDAATELNKESLKCVEAYREQNQDLKAQLEEAEKKNDSQHQHIRFLTRILAQHQLAAPSDVESLTKTAEQLKLKVKAEVSVNDYKHFAREDDKANDRWPVKGGMGVNQSFAFSLQQGQFFQPLTNITNCQNAYDSSAHQLLGPTIHLDNPEKGTTTSQETKLNPESSPFTPSTGSNAHMMDPIKPPPPPLFPMPSRTPVITTPAPFTQSLAAANISSTISPPSTANQASTPFRTPMSVVNLKQDKSPTVMTPLPPHLRILTPTPKRAVNGKELSTLSEPANMEFMDPLINIQHPNDIGKLITGKATTKKEQDESMTGANDEATKKWLDEQLEKPAAPLRKYSPAPSHNQLIDLTDEAQHNSVAKDLAEKIDDNGSASSCATRGKYSSVALVPKMDETAFSSQENSERNILTKGKTSSADPQPDFHGDRKQRLRRPRFDELDIGEKPQSTKLQLATPFQKPMNNDPSAFLKDFNSKLSTFSSKWSRSTKDSSATHPGFDHYNRMTDDDLEEGEVPEPLVAKHSTNSDEEGILQIVPNGMTIPKRTASQKATTDPPTPPPPPMFLNDATSANIRQTATDVLRHRAGPRPSGTRILGEMMDKESRAIVLKPSVKFAGKSVEAGDLEWRKVEKKVDGGNVRDCFVL